MAQPAAAREPDELRRESAPCDNCGAVLVGPFCHLCGQRDTDHLASVREFFAHLAEVAIGYDSRFLRTVRSLFLRPGFLTAEYIAGRRARYLAPVQVYLAAATLLFLVASSFPIVAFDPATRAFSSGISTLSVHDSLPRADVDRLRARGISLDLFAERFSNTTTNHLSTLLVLIVPLFAVVVAATFALDRRPFAHHILFALHWTAFYLAILAVLQPFPLNRFPLLVVHQPPAVRLAFMCAAMALLLGGPFVYLLLALRRTYATGWLATAMRGGALYFAFIFILAQWLELVTAYTARHL